MFGQHHNRWSLRGCDLRRAFTPAGHHLQARLLQACEEPRRSEELEAEAPQPEPVRPSSWTSCTLTQVSYRHHLPLHHEPITPLMNTTVLPPHQRPGQRFINLHPDQSSAEPQNPTRTESLTLLLTRQTLKHSKKTHTHTHTRTHARARRAR